MTRHVVGAASRSLRVLATGLLPVALLLLIAISVVEILAGVVRPLLGPGAVTGAVRAGALIAALVPFAFLVAHGCVAVVACGRQLRQRGRDRTTP